MLIRPERPSDAGQVREVNTLAFGGPLEADLVDRLRDNCADALSLVAEQDGAVVGHILFTPVTITSGGRDVVGMGLAPMGVRPERQRQGIGSALVRHGLDLLRERRCPFVVVVGHPEYYPRFGFARASLHGIRSQWDGIAEDAWMVAIIDRQAMAGVSGMASYRDEFNGLT
ncbi:MAG: N-acetyltransferase [Acidimicrobiia bacterium]|nr:N-acetyltransferase [Acidimicrobiia bacterium]